MYLIVFKEYSLNSNLVQNITNVSGDLLTVLSGVDASSMFHLHTANVPAVAVNGYPLSYNRFQYNILVYSLQCAVYRARQKTISSTFVNISAVSVNF